MKFVAAKNGLTKKFFHPCLLLLFLDPGSGIRDPGSGIRDPGSGMGKNQDPGSGIRDKHPGSATLPEFTCDGPKLADLFPHPFRKALTITDQ